MEETTAIQEQSLTSVQSPLKPRQNEGAKKGDSGHTWGVDVGEASLKGEYEVARDKRVADTVVTSNVTHAQYGLTLRTAAHICQRPLSLGLRFFHLSHTH